MVNILRVRTARNILSLVIVAACRCTSYLHVVLDFFSQIKKASAEGEDAWKGAGTKEGLQVWRIVKFKVHAECSL